jgi:uncharacterized membrane protein HdeD (DUF308 family)
MKRPTRITIIGALFMIGGCLAAWEVINDLFHSHVNLNFGVLMIPVGIGLLKGRASSRGWTKFWIGLFSLVFGGLLVFYPFFGDSYSVEWFDEEITGSQRHAVAIGVPIIFLLISRWMWRSLSLPSAAPFFDDFKTPMHNKSAHPTAGNVLL